jgi:hypothetical protein
MLDNTEAIKTIRIHNWKWSRTKAVKYAQKYLDLVSNRYPNGLPENTKEEYFVLPGFDHVTKNQPIMVFSPTQLIWELTSTSLFLEPKK